MFLMLIIYQYNKHSIKKTHAKLIQYTNLYYKENTNKSQFSKQEIPRSRIPFITAEIFGGPPSKRATNVKKHTDTNRPINYKLSALFWPSSNEPLYRVHTQGDTLAARYSNVKAMTSHQELCGCGSPHERDRTASVLRNPLQGRLGARRLECARPGEDERWAVRYVLKPLVLTIRRENCADSTSSFRCETIIKMKFSFN